MNRKTKSRIRAAICCVFAFLISLLLFFASLLLVTDSTVLQESYARKSMEESSYYQQLTMEIRNHLQGYSDATGIDKEFFSECVEELQVRDAVSQELDSLYQNKASTLGAEQVKKDFYTKFEAYAQSRNMELTEETRAALQYLAGVCAEDYISAVSIPFLSTFSLLVQKLDGIALKALLALVVIIVILIAYFFFVNRWKHRAVRYLIYALSGGFLLVLSLPAAVLLSNKIGQIALVNESAYGFAVNYLNGIFYMMLIIAAVLAVLIAVLAIVYRTMRKRSME